MTTTDKLAEALRWWTSEKEPVDFGEWVEEGIQFAREALAAYEAEAKAAPQPSALIDELEKLTRHDWRSASIWRHYYPSATGDWVNLRELRAMLAAAPAAPAEPVADTPPNFAAEPDSFDDYWMARWFDTEALTDEFKATPVREIARQAWEAATPAAPAPHPDTQDAERLRYLLSDDGDWTLCEWDHDAGYWVSDQREPDVVRAAIDAAIAASKGGAA
jgi:hypothetical protein